MRQIGYPKNNQRLLEQFALRLNDACDNNPNIPPMYHGRQVWVREALERKGSDVSLQTINKWFGGKSFPTRERTVIVAQLLDVDPTWLSSGVSGKPEHGSEAQTLGVLRHDTPAYLVSALIQFDGGTANIAALRAGYLLRAKIRFATYEFAVLEAVISGDMILFRADRVETSGRLTLIVLREEGFNFRIFQLTPDELDARRQEGTADIAIPISEITTLREIRSFKDPI